jgi:hypothetical protein
MFVSSGESPLDVMVALPLESWAAPESDRAIQLDSCRRLERIVVRTHYSVYELIVLGGGEVLVRGGKRFPEFRRARLAGSSRGGSALTLRSLDVSRHMELQADGKYVVTSAIESISRGEDEGD